MSASGTFYTIGGILTVVAGIFFVLAYRAKESSSAKTSATIDATNAAVTAMSKQVNELSDLSMPTSADDIARRLQIVDQVKDYRVWRVFLADGTKVESPHEAFASEDPSVRVDWGATAVAKRKDDHSARETWHIRFPKVEYAGGVMENNWSMIVPGIINPGASIAFGKIGKLWTIEAWILNRKVDTVQIILVGVRAMKPEEVSGMLQ